MVPNTYLCQEIKKMSRVLLSYDKTSIFAGRGKKTARGFGGFIYR